MLVLDGRDGERDVNQIATLSKTNGFEVLDPPARTDVLEDRLLVRMQVTGTKF
jgi:hypothetical protein